jgi:hypothetical protein
VFDVLLASKVRSFIINRAFALRLKAVPSASTEPVAEIWTGR